MDADPNRNLQALNATRKTSEKSVCTCSPFQLQPTSEFQDAGNSWTTHDRACTHCRERKIRCGREKPQCANCERDGVECGYYPPGKRVNHIKLLCNNVGSLEDRLCCIEGELSRLTAFLKAGGIQSTMNASAAAQNVPAQLLSPDGRNSRRDSFVAPTNRHIVRNRSNHTDCYHGPCTLFALCKELSGALLSEPPCLGIVPLDGTTIARITQEREAIKDVLTRICVDLAMDGSFNPQADYATVGLPAKRFLLMAIPQFFEHADYSTDIFVRSSFMNRVELIYDPNCPAADEAWAICFNVIIVLVLGAENAIQGTDFLLGPQFTQPFLFAVRSALSKVNTLMMPKLVNMQALTLLSLAAQQYCSPGVASSIFAQACVLAKLIGIHQLRVVSDTFCQDEALECFKVMRSLYLRDKRYSLLRGSVCWLPASDCTLSLDSGYNEVEYSAYGPRIQLAALQERVYRLFYSAESHREPRMDDKLELLRIEKSLQLWADAHEIFTTCCLDADLVLEFLATRICALRESSEPDHIIQALNDARSSCLLLLMSYGKVEQSAVDSFGDSLIPKCATRVLGKEITSRPGKCEMFDNGPTHGTANENENGFVSVRFYSLLETFSAPGFFLLVKNTISTLSDSDNSQAKKDLDLLERVCGCYAELEGAGPTDAHIHKVSLVFAGLVQVVNLLTPRPPAQLSSNASQQTGTYRSTETPNIVGKYQGIPDLPDAPGPSAYLTPSMSQDGLSSNVRLMRSADTTSTATSPILLTSMEEGYMGQWYDPSRQQSFSTLLPQRQPTFSSRKRARPNDADSAIDTAGDQHALAEFLNTSAMMPF